MEEPVKIFKYDRLQQVDAIRLLILHSGPPGSTLRCTLAYTTLARCRYDIHGRYTALSYVWGNPDDRRTIFIDDLPCTITANLASALDGLRDEADIFAFGLMPSASINRISQSVINRLA
jgi:hypothetical protein